MLLRTIHRLQQPSLPAGWCVIAQRWESARDIVGPCWLARPLRWLTRARDRVARAWGLHCYDMGLIREGDYIPWPRFLKWFW